MTPNKFGQLVYSESDVCDMLMQGHDLARLNSIVVDGTVDVSKMPTDLMDGLPVFATPAPTDLSVDQFHQQQQCSWHMPDSYKELDIAAHVLSLCNTQEELQRCGTELMMFQERDLFDLLRYLKYLVDVMRQNHIIWGVGRGSSVASYVLYLLGVHKINSMFYDLDPQEFLR